MFPFLIGKVLTVARRLIVIDQSHGMFPFLIGKVLTQK